ncbi:MAG: hypothetical protein JW797_05405 [Bradymonadales bacterium]|nr:hypothetical protein [Bradymonadales bacterium]
MQISPLIKAIPATRLVAFAVTLTAALVLLSLVPVDEDRAVGLTASQLAADQVFPSLLESWQSLQPEPLPETPRVHLRWEGSPAVGQELEWAARHRFELVEAAEGVPDLSLTVLVENDQLELGGSLSEGSLTASGSARIGRWISLVPPLLAILVALFLRKLLVAMVSAIIVGSLLHFQGNPVVDLAQGAQVYLWGVLSDTFNLQILAFTFGLVGMVMVATRSGGSQGLIDQVARIASSARSTRIATFLMGLVIFFDDYANAIVVGTTARPMTDRHRISREKLAYLVDSTSAPVAGLAVISTWIAFEVGLLQPLIDQLHLELEPGVQTSGYSMFLAMLPFRFYCLITLAFVLSSAMSSRDFGSMLKAERRAATTGQLLAPDARPLTSSSMATLKPDEGAPCRWYNAVIPILVAVGMVIAGMLYSGRGAVYEAGMAFDLLRLETWKLAFGAADSGLVLVVAAGASSAVAILLPVLQRILRLRVAVVTWLKAIPATWLAISILVCAWAIRAVCDDLGTSVFLISALGESIPPLLFPLFTFFLAALVAFSTGTSWGTMGILLPLIVPWAYTLAQQPDVPALLVLVSAAAVLDGAIMGDHCSPISDTTVMSSIASSCDHIDHVRTQLPYAITCALLASLAYATVVSELPLGVIYLLALFLVLSILGLVGRPISPVRPR